MAKNLFDIIKRQPLIKLSVDTVLKHKETLVPVLFVSIFGGVVFYLVKSRRRKEITRYVREPKDETSLGDEISLSDLPQEIRGRIWKLLEYEDLLQLRLVSDFTKDDIENWVGVKMTIDDKDSEKYEFAQSVALQRCKMTDLSFEMNSEFLLHPGLMLELEIMEKTPTPLRNLSNLLAPCVNLLKLEMHFSYSPEVSEISARVLASISKMPHLQELKLFRISTHSPVLKSFHPNSTPNNFSVPKKLIHIEIELPDATEDQLGTWKYLLEQQTHLETLILNFGAVFWHFVLGTIPNNPRLTQIGLEGICDINPNNEEVTPFDWGIFTKCLSLEYIEVACPAILHAEQVMPISPMTSVNFQAFPCKNIEEFYVYRVVMSPEDVQRVYQQMPKLKSGSLNRIGDAGTAAATEMFWIQRQQEENARDEFGNRERIWDIVLHSTIGLSIMGIVFAMSMARPASHDTIEFYEDDE